MQTCSLTWAWAGAALVPLRPCWGASTRLPSAASCRTPLLLLLAMLPASADLPCLLPSAVPRSAATTACGPAGPTSSSPLPPPGPARSLTPLLLLAPWEAAACCPDVLAS